MEVEGIHNLSTTPGFRDETMVQGPLEAGPQQADHQKAHLTYKDKLVQAESSPSQATVTAEEKATYGPWMVVARRRSKNDGNQAKDKRRQPGKQSDGINRGPRPNTDRNGNNNRDVGQSKTAQERKGKKVDCQPTTVMNVVVHQYSTDKTSQPRDTIDNRASSSEAMAIRTTPSEFQEPPAKTQTFPEDSVKGNRPKASNATQSRDLQNQDNPSNGGRGSQPPFSSLRQNLDEERSCTVSDSSKPHYATNRSKESNRTNLGQADCSGSQAQPIGITPPFGLGSGDGTRPLSLRTKQEHTPPRYSGSRVQGGKIGSRRRSRSPHRQSLGNLQHEEGHLQSRDGIHQDDGDSQICEGNPNYRSILHRARNNADGIQLSGSAQLPFGGQHSLAKEQRDGDFDPGDC
ncbi:putative chloroplast RF19 protein [Corchorus olitorius]|uniref:Chloroplast RF19 protein n=1 Tax=Corchorus olitorius TaxID=93759 RepID=A0A1R3IKN1_9ROSI|nr:putative chloroplast RF19 protein [Corchorus olitorius]